MSAKMFISLMLVLMVFTAGLFVYAKPSSKEAKSNECPAGAASGDDSQTKTSADAMIWESVSKHLLSAVQ